MAFRFSELRTQIIETAARSADTSNSLFGDGTGSNAPTPLKSLRVRDTILPSDTAINPTIGSSNNPFKTAWIDELHLSTNTLYIGDTPILGTDQDTINIKADPDQSILVKTTGLGETSLSSAKGVNVSTSGFNSVIDITASGSGGQVTVGGVSQITLNAPTTTVSSNLTVQGDLTVSGTNFIVNTQTVEVADNIMLLNSGQTGSGVSAGTAGLSIDRGDALNYQLLFDETDDTFKVGPQGSLLPIATSVDLQTKLSTASNLGDLTNVAQARSNLGLENVSVTAMDASNITSGTLAVARGGTGTTTSTGTGAVVRATDPTLIDPTVSGSNLYVFGNARVKIAPNALTLFANPDIGLDIHRGTGTYNPDHHISIMSANPSSWSGTCIRNGDSAAQSLLMFAGGGANGNNGGAFIQAQDIRSGRGWKLPLRLNADGGNVGIGTGSDLPSEKLHVNGNLLVTSNIETSGIHVAGNLLLDGNITTTGGVVSTRYSKVWESERLGMNGNTGDDGWSKIATLPLQTNSSNGAMIRIVGVWGSYAARRKSFEVMVMSRGFVDGYLRGTSTGEEDDSSVHDFELYKEANGGFSLYHRSAGPRAFCFTVSMTGNYGLEEPNGAVQTTTPTGTLVQSFLANINMHTSLSGNVGIGTSAPTEKLHVAGNILATGDIDTQGNIKVFNSSSNDSYVATWGQSLHEADNRASTWFGRYDNDWQNSMRFLGMRCLVTDDDAQNPNTNDNHGHLDFITLGTGVGASTSRMRIWSDGVVGIGSNLLKPRKAGYKLEVDGNILADQLHCDGSIQTNAFIDLGSSYTNQADFGTRFIQDDTTGRLFIQHKKDVCFVRLGGYVGIQTTTPAYPLDVVGDINSSTNVRASGVVLTSDDRVKSDEVFIADATATLKKLRPQTYSKWSTMDYAGDSNATSYTESGFVAQEVFYDAHELRHLVQIPVDADSNALYTETIASSSDPALDPTYTSWGSNTASFNYIGLIPYLTKALQEKDEQLALLEARVAALEV